MGLNEPHPDEELEWLATPLSRHRPQRLVEFLNGWMEILVGARKSWSYLGAVRGKRSGDLTFF